MIKNIKKELFWFNYVTCEVNYTSENRPSEFWRFVTCLTYPFGMSEINDELPQAELFLVYNELGVYHKFNGGEKPLVVGYAVRRNQETGYYDEIYPLNYNI